MSYPYGGGGPGYPAQGGGYPAPGAYGSTMPPQPNAGGYPAPGGPGYPTGGPGYPAGPPAPMAPGPGYPAGPPGPGYPAAPPAGGMPMPGGSPYPDPYGAPQPPAPSGGGLGFGAPPPAGPGYPAAPPPAAGPGMPQPGYGGGAPGGYAPGPQAQSYQQPPQSYSPVPPTSGTAPARQAAAAPHVPTSEMAKMKIGSATAKVPQTQGTVTKTAGFNAEEDAKKLRKAMKGLGTDEKAIIDILAYRTSAERQQIRQMFKTMYGKDLINDLKSELGGKFEGVVLALMKPSDEYDASELRRAMKGVGTDERAMIEILCSRTNKELNTIKQTYKAVLQRNLENDIISETSGHFKRLMVSLANAGRIEDPTTNQQRATEDARLLYEAGEKRLGTDESKFNQILASQSFPQLRLVFDEYSKISRKSIEQAISSEMSGDLEDGMLAVVKCVRNTPAFFAERLYKSMKGLGTDDDTLIRIVVSRCEVDMVQIKQEFQKMYHKTLESFIKGDCSGHYKRVLIALVGGNPYTK